MLTYIECLLVVGKEEEFLKYSLIHVHQQMHPWRCRRHCLAATDPPVVQEPTCNSYLFSLDWEHP